VGIATLLELGIYLGVEAVVAMLAEIKDGPRRGGAKSADHQTRDANGIIATDEPGKKDEDANGETVGGEGVEKDMDVFGFEAKQARRAAALHFVGEQSRGREGNDNYN